MNVQRAPTKKVARVEDVPRAVILLVATNLRVGLFSSVFGLLGWWVEHSQ